MNEWKKAKKDKTKKKFLEIINKQRKIKIVPSDKITVNEWEQ